MPRRRQKLRNGSWIIPGTGERSRRQFTLRYPSLDGPSDDDGIRSLSQGETTKEKVLNLLPYGDEFRRQRKWVQDAFQTKKSLQNYQALQRRAVIELLNRLVDKPDLFSEHFTRYGGRFLFSAPC